MKNVLKLCVLIATILMITFVGCKKEKSDDNSSKGTMQSITMQGIVSDNTGKALSGVKVTTGTASAVTGGDGKFTFSQAEVVNKRVVIKFEKTGYFTLTRSGVKQGDMFIEAVLQPTGNSDITLETTFESSEGKTLEVPKGMKVKIAPSSICYADGKPFNGKVKANMLYLDPNHENFSDMMPGGDLLALQNNEEVLLISWGMTNVVLTDESNKPLQLDAPAEVTYPIPDGMKNNPPPTIPLWHFDEAKGIWIHDGEATLRGDVYVGKVNHFSWSNLDEPKKRATVFGRVTYIDGKWYYWKPVKVGPNKVTTNSKGEFTTYVPENTEVEIEITEDGKKVTKPVPPTPGGDEIKDFTIVIPWDGPDDEGGEPETMLDTNVGSVNYNMQGTNNIITFDKNGRLFRLDIYNNGKHEITIINKDNKTVFLCSDEATWEDDSEKYNDHVSLINGQMALCKAMNYHYQLWPKIGMKNIAGKSCKMYSTGWGEDKVTIGVWNGLVMVLEATDVVPYIAEAATIKVPDKAFTTECITPDWFTKK